MEKDVDTDKQQYTSSCLKTPPRTKSGDSDVYTPSKTQSKNNFTPSQTPSKVILTPSKKSGLTPTRTPIKTPKKTLSKTPTKTNNAYMPTPTKNSLKSPRSKTQDQLKSPNTASLSSRWVGKLNGNIFFLKLGRKKFTTQIINIYIQINTLF